MKKWLICSWLHYRHRCYPEVCLEKAIHWHCMKCHPCSDGLFEALKVGLTDAIEFERRVKG